ncbi:hypothetical protein, variant [Exophiala oligosperma]|uniref:CENP-V/GFA domain-containing protein n=2 Tax=Chaetothyriales TaxID=34395 RepID=A0A0D2E9T9_9EURO|nr:uncharacterized protein PV06_03190 [Exophiala oligosperma]XP_016264956.1 hypothetical protein, variant [Exophiala oligosperma]KAJ9642248.1 hypothetical protein H2204_002617 [Knufia peltigerae]KIW44739.1 hypothetical protein PV06_03190 [Exophiala oligosperma]KIW44740.1 hypothetical protein, variant [Exophiala oligosperma]
MPTGSCFCKGINLEYTGEPAMTALCHCNDCRHISGGLYSHNIVVPSEQVKITKGAPKEISTTANSGKRMTNCFCPDCGTTLFRYGDTFGGRDGLLVLKAGIMDDADVINNTKPGAELFAPRRIDWVEGIGGAAQVEEMPPPS